MRLITIQVRDDGSIDRLEVDGRDAYHAEVEAAAEKLIAAIEAELTFEDGPENPEAEEFDDPRDDYNREDDLERAERDAERDWFEE